MAALNPDELWPVAQRLLYFEEPALKWLHLKRWLKRTAQRQGYIAETLLPAKFSWPPLFDQLLGSAQSSEQIFSALFALEETKRLSGMAFERWKREADGIVISDKSLDLSHLEIETEAVLWINFFCRFCPCWSALWSEHSGLPDRRRQFVEATLELIQTNKRKSQSGEDWQGLRELFRETLGQWRSSLPGHFLPDLIVLVEGATETILLPLLAGRLGLDLDGLGAMIIAAGGANQVARRYKQMKEIVAIPIFCLLDRDAQEQKDLISGQLRGQDFLYMLKEGEIEDLIRLESLVPLLNSYLSSTPYCARSYQPIEERDFQSGLGRTGVLEKLWRERQLGKFDKVGFARFVAAQSVEPHAISPDGRLLVQSLGAYKNPPK